MRHCLYTQGGVVAAIRITGRLLGIIALLPLPVGAGMENA
jgi:hypothetical protein